MIITEFSTILHKTCCGSLEVTAMSNMFFMKKYVKSSLNYRQKPTLSGSLRNSILSSDLFVYLEVCSQFMNKINHMTSLLFSVVTSCHKNYMTAQYITLGYWNIIILSMTKFMFPVEVINIPAKVSYDKQNLTLMVI